MVYEALAEQKSIREAMVFTVIEGSGAGSHALFTGGERRAVDGDFPEAILPDLAGVKESGLFLLGGEKLYGEKVGRDRTLVICGGGHVAMAVLRLAKLTGFETWVLEDRPLYAREAEELGADHILTGSFPESLRQIPSPGEACYVVMTRGHRYDLLCLREILPIRPLYAGMMCSRKRIAEAGRLLLAEGITEEELAGLHAPIGLSIGAETPEEIGISVLAELISVLREEEGHVIPREILRGIVSGEEERVLVQIVERRGSAPRRAGTKMIVPLSGRLVGTIGGGCFEAEVVREARMLLAGQEKTKLLRVDLSGLQDMDAEGSACGGVMDVFLERLPASVVSSSQ